MPRSSSKKTAPAPIVAKASLSPNVAKAALAPNVTGSSLMQTVKEGFSFGLGSAIAHRVVGGLFGSSSSPPPPPPQEAKRSPTEYEQCLAEHRDFGDSTAMCSYLLKAKETSIIQG